MATHTLSCTVLPSRTSWTSSLWPWIRYAIYMYIQYCMYCIRRTNLLTNFIWCVHVYTCTLYMINNEITKQRNTTTTETTLFSQVGVEPTTLCSLDECIYTCTWYCCKVMIQWSVGPNHVHVFVKSVKVTIACVTASCLRVAVVQCALR